MEPLLRRSWTICRCPFDDLGGSRLYLAKATRVLLTSSTAQRSSSVLNKRDVLKTEAVDVLSGVVEARNVRGSSPIRCVPRVTLRVCYTV